MKQVLAQISAIFLLCLASLAPNAGTYNSVISINDPMPTFSNLPGVDGGTLSSADIKEEVVVLVSMSNACPFSTGAETDLIELVDDLKGKSVRFIAVGLNQNAADNLEAMKKRAQQAGYNFAYLRDRSQELGRALGATRTPEFFVFNKDRELVYTGLLHNSPAMRYGDEAPSYLKGKPSEFYVRDAIQLTLAGKPVAVQETAPYGCTVEYDNSDRDD